jgi:type III pantothenate kinase
MKKIIAIDVGNSETTVGVGNSDNWESYRYTTRKTVTSDELLMMFRTTIDLSKADDELLHGAIVCSVVPQITDSVVSAINKFSSKEVLVVGPGIKTGLKVNIDNPKELGPDRIANSVGGYKKINKEVIIVDLGTATTFDVVNHNKEYLGGSIAPGIKISLDALISRTSSLKSVELKEPNKAIGKNTYEAIQSGLVLGHASMIDSMLEKIVLESELSPGVVVTGGLGTLIQPVLNINTIYERNLTLDGLEEIYNLNN